MMATKALETQINATVPSANSGQLESNQYGSNRSGRTGEILWTTLPRAGRVFGDEWTLQTKSGGVERCRDFLWRSGGRAFEFGVCVYIQTARAPRAHVTMRLPIDRRFSRIMRSKSTVKGMVESSHGLQ
jgi:hypothetical protein